MVEEGSKNPSCCDNKPRPCHREDRITNQSHKLTSQLRLILDLTRPLLFIKVKIYRLCIQESYPLKCSRAVYIFRCPYEPSSSSLDIADQKLKVISE